MSNSNSTVAVTLTAFDRMSRVVDQAVSKSIKALNGFKKTADNLATKGLSMQNLGSTILGSQMLQQPIQAFAELEDGMTRLKSVMMGAGGIDGGSFDKINKVAIELGNALPGATNDFYKMFATMIQGGLKAENIISGTGKAAAYLAVQLQLPFDEVGQGVAKLREAAGIADADMMKFMDTIQRTANVGVKFDEMQIAFARSAGQLKFLKLQGLQASNEVAALYAMLIKSGATGETVGTGIANAMSAVFDSKKMALANAEAAKLGIQFKFLDDKGNFLGINNFIGQFGRLKGFSQQQISKVLTPIFGATGQDAGFIKTLASGGLPAFTAMQNKMKEQADLEKRVAMQLSTLKNVWDSLTGTFTNFLAVVGGSVAPALKSLANFLNTLTSSTSEFLEKHTVLSKILGWSIGIVGGLAVAAGGLGLTLGLVAKVASFSATGFIMLGKAASWAKFGMWYLSASVKAWSIWSKIAAAAQWVFNASLFGCPIVWIVAGIAAVIAAVVLMVKYWKPITAFFGRVWDGIKNVFNSFVGFIKKWWQMIFYPISPFIALPALIIKTWSKFGSKLFNAGANIVKSIWDGIKSLASKPVEAIQNIVKKIRDFLPFSPAKVGPLKDLHKVRIIETIASTIKPMPVVSAMSRATGSIRSQAARGSGGGGGISLTYSPVVTITGSGAGSKEDFAVMLKNHESQLIRIVAEAGRKAERKRY